MLYIVATPIGNLEDITLRALSVLRNCDYILCEDTRTSAVLLNHYDIKKTLVSYHKFNEQKRQEGILKDLKNGLTLCLISDAGMPAIADPGSLLVQAALDHQIPVSCIPGPSAFTTAMASSGLLCDRFQFVGFLPKTTHLLRKTLSDYLAYPGATLCYVTPHHLIQTLELVIEQDSQRFLVIARELTKKFEEIKRGNASDLIDYFNQKGVKGEIVLIISASTQPCLDWTILSAQDHVAYLQETFKLDKKEAILIAAQLRGIPKRACYKELISDTE